MGADDTDEVFHIISTSITIEPMDSYLPARLRLMGLREIDNTIGLTLDVYVIADLDFVAVCFIYQFQSGTSMCSRAGLDSTTSRVMFSAISLDCSTR